MQKFVYDIGSSGQSYKVSMSINYNQRVTITSKLIIFMALDRRGFISMTTFVYLKAWKIRSQIRAKNGSIVEGETERGKVGGLLWIRASPEEEKFF